MSTGGRCLRSRFSSPFWLSSPGASRPSVAVPRSRWPGSIDALGAAEEQPDLLTTLHSVAGSVGHAVRARIAGVVVRDRDQVTVAAWTTGRAAPAPAEAEQLTRAELELGSASPFVAGLSARRPLVVDDFDTDARFGGWSGPWAKVLRGLGCRSLALVPLRLGHEVIGALVAAYTRPGAISDDDLAFLEAFADRAAPIAVRARAYDQERESAEKLARLDRQKGEFLALVSHELRTPLTAVKGFVDTVLEHWQTLPDHRRRELLDRASSNADELNRLVGQLLDFARLDAANVRMTPQRIELSEEVADVLENLAAALAEHPVEMDVPAGVRDPRRSQRLRRRADEPPDERGEVLDRRRADPGARRGRRRRRPRLGRRPRRRNPAGRAGPGLRPLLPVAVELADAARHRHRTHDREAVHRDAGRADQPRERARVGLDVLRVDAGGDVERGSRRTRRGGDMMRRPTVVRALAVAAAALGATIAVAAPAHAQILPPITTPPIDIGVPGLGIELHVPGQELGGSGGPGFRPARPASGAGSSAPDRAGWRPSGGPGASSGTQGSTPPPGPRRRPVRSSAVPADPTVPPSAAPGDTDSSQVAGRALDTSSRRRAADPSLGSAIAGAVTEPSTLVGALTLALGFGVVVGAAPYLPRYRRRQRDLLEQWAQASEREHAVADKLTQADQQKSEFLALVSHELRTPLTAVKGFVDTVLLHWDRLPDDRRRELLDAERRRTPTSSAGSYASSWSSAARRAARSRSRRTSSTWRRPSTWRCSASRRSPPVTAWRSTCPTGSWSTPTPTRSTTCWSTC